jgi:hypothetical protein
MMMLRLKRHTHVTGKTVLVKGSGPEPYKLQYNRETNVYSCTCTVWRHVPVRNNEKTCRHLWSIRGRDVEMGRVGEEGIAKMEKAEAELRRKHAPPGGVGGMGGHPPRPRPDAGHAELEAKRQRVGP